MVRKKWLKELFYDFKKLTAHEFLDKYKNKISPSSKDFSTDYIYAICLFNLFKELNLLDKEINEGELEEAYTLFKKLIKEGVKEELKKELERIKIYIV